MRIENNIPSDRDWSAKHGEEYEVTFDVTYRFTSKVTNAERVAIVAPLSTLGDALLHLSEGPNVDLGSFGDFRRGDEEYAADAYARGIISLMRETVDRHMTGINIIAIRESPHTPD